MESGEESSAARGRVQHWKILVPAALTVVSALVAYLSLEGVSHGRPGWAIFWSLVMVFSALGTLMGIADVTDASRLVRVLGIVAVLFAGVLLAFEVLLLVVVVMVTVANSGGA
ncbi:hypothetical protein [Curtobacterium sp. MCBA15_009]|uniref:hypothetical protein n=1 Tax=Curtobacterium sp. MCBA15_009 TaxID=1898737 RepID=UPI001114414B|nr:hypothetical protein [Curtobacterium sp. MCBA15_009]